MKPLSPEVKLERQNERLKIDNTSLRLLNKKLLRRSGGYEEFLERVQEVAEADRHFKYSCHKHKPAPTTIYDKTHEEIACVAVSDLHLTETVSPADANQVNVYNSMVAANRLWEHSQKVVSILRRHMAMYKLKMVWSPILGDMVNGSIHPEFLTTNDLPDQAAMVLCTRLLYMFYTELKSLGLPIEVDSIVGNHPRTTLKVPTKRLATTNLDWVVYQYLDDRFIGDDQIKFTNHTSQIGMRKLYGWNYIFEHGMDVRNGDIEGHEDRIRALFDDPTYREATGYQGSSFDQIVRANLHKPQFAERTIINGSYTGQNELGQSWRLKPIKAMQALWGVTKKHPRTFQYMIDLTDIKSQKADNPFSDYTNWFLKRHGNKG